MTSLAFPTLANELTVSPPNWWVDMAASDVELMVYGDDIADDTVTVSKGAVSITKTQALDSENYLFLTLNTEKAKAGEVILTFTDSDGTVREKSYSLLKRKAGSAQRQGFSPKDAIYLIAPDRFANGDPSNDNVEGYKDTVDRAAKGGRHGGDIKGIIDNLDYVKEMGFTQIWTMPLLENAMDNYSYHGYSTTDYYQVDPRFGSNQDYVELSEKASEAGIGIIMDMVLNHIGSTHQWMKDKPSQDWINNNGIFVGTTHKRESLHDPHAVESDKIGFSDGWFVPTMPDLNQRNPHLANYLIQNAIWWVEFANLSGIRVDTYSYPDKDFLSQWTTRVIEEYPNLNIVGEEWSVNPAITAYWQRGSHKHDDYVSALPSVMDFPLQTALVKALDSAESWNSGFISVYETLATDFLYAEPNNLVVFADNHDMSRVFTQLGHDVRKWNMAMTFFLTTRGIPQVFYGTEILMQNEGTTDHGVIRTDFPGGWKEDTDKNAFNGKGLSEEERWAQQRTKSLLSLRREYPALFEGELKHFAPKDGLYTYFRVNENDKSRALMVILNKEETDVTLSQYRELLGRYTKITRLDDGKVMRTSDVLSLPAMSATVFIAQ
ncbi:glycoside hydrolase family 13 protein [Alteromonas sp. 009811495]|uniref:glycoside hydrolase family 13 protein n=1 Tax=Alteromonas sp. 009811495 TaxID=3002962 RepID=UPI00237DF9FF|nr:glycoside hydrolase family 13 protein [Alteromonas sp. 009811495]WDT88136.1 glycoside hydrolase family 13 protein [Alteromonas sp. 009811495]